MTWTQYAIGFAAMVFILGAHWWDYYRGIR